MNKYIELLKKSISKNFGWKVFSFLTAILVWFVVMNIINPTEVKTFSVNLTLLNKDKLEDNEFVILNQKELENTKVDIKVRATRPALDELSKAENRKNIKATIDLQQFDVLYAKDITEPLNVTVTPSLPSNLYLYSYEITSFSPGKISISLDNLVSTTKTVLVEKVGEVREGYVSMYPVINPETIQIRGAASEIAKVSSVKVKVNLADATTDIVSNATPIIYDEDNNELTGFKLSTQTVNVRVGVNKNGQIAIADPVITGTPQDGFSYIETQWSPKYIEVIGSAEDMAKVNKIELPNISIDGSSEDKTVVFDIRPYLRNTNLNIKSGTPNEVTVVAKIEKNETRRIEISKENINIKNLDEKYNLEFINNIFVELSSSKNKLANISENDISVEIDLQSIAEGRHSIKASFRLPEGVTQLGDVFADVNIFVKSEESTETTTFEGETFETTDITETTTEEQTTLESETVIKSDNTTETTTENTTDEVTTLEIETNT